MSSILFLGLMNSDPWGGSEELWYGQALYCAQNGHAVTCMVYYWPEKQAKLQLLKNAGCSIIEIPNTGRRKKHFFQKIRYEFITKLQQQLFVHSQKVSHYNHVIVSQGAFMEVCNGPWKTFYKKLSSYVLIYHNYFPDFVFPTKKALILRNWIRCAKNNFFDAGKIKTVLEKQLNITEIHGITVYNPLTIPQQLYSIPYPSIANEIIMVVLAQLDVHRKAQDILIKALATNIWKERNFILNLYGDGNDKAYLQQLIQECQLTDKVFLKGKTNKVDEVLKNSHIVLQLTHIDAMPIAVIEGMCMSRPVITSNVGDMPLWVKNGINGWCCEAPTIANISQVLETAWEEKDKWEAMGKEAFNIYKVKFPNSVQEFFYSKAIQPYV